MASESGLEDESLSSEAQTFNESWNNLMEMGEKMVDTSTSAVDNISEEQRDLDRLTAETLAMEVNEMKKRREEQEEESSNTDESSSVSTENEGMAVDPEPQKEESPPPIRDSGDKDGPLVSSKGGMDALDECHAEGYLAWAKLKGYSYWPAVVTVDPIEGLTMKKSETVARKQSLKTHLHFLGYENQRAWISDSCIMKYNGLKEFQKMAVSARGSQRRDFQPSRKLKPVFDKAVALAEEALLLRNKKRLEFLGYVYVLVPNKQPDVRTPAAKKIIPSTATKDESSQKVFNGNRSPKQKNWKRPKKQVEVASPLAKEEIKDIHDYGKDEFQSDEDEATGSPPKLGSLVWGRMSTFPFWPCFVTKAPSGDFFRKTGKQASYHVQFFNWNNESGWVNRTLPWCSLEEFKQRSLTLSKQEWKNWYPQGKHMVHKWEKAYELADSTSNLSRKERYQKFMAFYQSAQETKQFDQNNAVLNPPKRGRRRSKDLRKESTNKNPRKQSHRQPGTLSKGPKGVKRKNSQGWSEETLSSSELPPGWRSEVNHDDNIEYKSPDGLVFTDVGSIVSHLFQQNIGLHPRKRSYSVSSDRLHTSEGPGWFLNDSDSMRYLKLPQEVRTVGPLHGRVCYFEDFSLPPDWKVKEILSPCGRTVIYIPPNKHENNYFTSKWEVANYIESMGHPATELEHFLSLCVKKAALSSRKKFKVQNVSQNVSQHQHSKCNYTFNLISTTAEDIMDHPVLGKTVLPCFVEIVRLPDLFLQHSSVLVKEFGNEMVITDANTDQFIAKKIIYD